MDGSTGDHMIEMIPPISRLGRTFITSPLYKRSTGEVYKLIAGNCIIYIYMYCSCVYIQKTVSLSNTSPKQIETSIFVSENRTYFRYNIGKGLCFS